MSNNLITLPGKILSNNIYGTEHLPLLSKEYNLYEVGELQDDHDGNLFFIDVIPTSDNIFDTWSIEYKLYVITPDNDLLQGYYECNISIAGSNLTSDILNGFGTNNNSQGFPIESHLIVRYTNLEKYQNRNIHPIKIGVSVSDNLERIYKVEIYSTYGCSATILDNIETYNDVWNSSIYDSIDIINAKTNLISDINRKADKVSNAINGNFAGLNSSGNLIDSGHKHSDYATADQGILASTAYQKPSTGIPKTDLDSSVQTSLNKAETALQTHQDISGKVDKISSTDNAVVRFDGTSGDVQNSGVLISDDNNLLTPGNITAGGNNVYIGSTSGSQCHMQFDDVNKCLKFIFD